MSPFWGTFRQGLSCKGCHIFVILETKVENWDGADFKIGVGTVNRVYKYETADQTSLSLQI